MAKTTVFNLIILDESGSMSGCRKATISGCNETIDVARRLQKENPDTQRTFMSIYAFQSGGRPSRYLLKNVPVENVKDITEKDYDPTGCTPLYDAMGSTMVDLQAVASTHEDATGIITVITDGYENSSTHYSREDVVKLVNAFKEMGWTVNFIGANIDALAASRELDIDNSFQFDNTEKGTSDMFIKYSCCIEANERDRIAREKDMDLETRLKTRKSMSKRFFKK